MERGDSFQLTMPQIVYPLLLSVFLHLLIAVHSKLNGAEFNTRFDFGTLTLSSLKLLGDAHIKNGSIQLTRDLPVPNSGAGRALYARPIRFRHPVTGTPFSFSTFFSFSITNLNPSSIGGGLAFVLSSDNHSLGDAGGFLGLINASSPDDASIVFAVEFDTLMDVEFSDINGNHVGLDLNSLVSTQVTDLDTKDIDLKSGDQVNSWIEYDGADQLCQVFVSYSTVRPANPVLSLPVDLSRFIDDFMFVGFSGSTQGSTETHTVEWWSFSSSGSSMPVTDPSPSRPRVIRPSSPPRIEAQPPLGPSLTVSAAASPANVINLPPSSSCRSNGLCRPATVAGVTTAGIFIFAGLLALAILARRNRRTTKTGTLGVEITQCPREFRYKELTAATGGFDPSRIIGHGAFGTVYRGNIINTGIPIAIKRCTNGDTIQGKAEFLSELSIIAGLRHRNLVRLQGWCHQKGEILLVYDYMPNGSLDKALFEATATPLTWHYRKRIVTGVASALAYLHHECERQVIHRDVKSSNIMLDESFHARLGDFGLARQVDHGKSPDATVTAGTMGYLAPEYLLTGRATDKTDVFSFGAVVLEIACGRRPIEDGASTSGRGSNLVEWVWGLYGAGRIMEAVDPRIREDGDCDEGDVRKVMLVGLACSHPDPGGRPGMRSVVQMLSGEAEVPQVPVAKPAVSFTASTQHLLMSLQDSVSDFNAAMEGMSSSASSSSSICGGGLGLV